MDVAVIQLSDIAEWQHKRIGPGEWYRIDQDQVDLFADATGDRQWIHIDPVRAAGGPFGATIAHGYLVLSLVPALMADLYRVEHVRMAVNCGLNRVRFVTPVRTGSRIRVQFEITSVTALADCFEVIIRSTVELEGSERPACVADSVRRLYPFAEGDS
jgi:acyl dehydratase